jgi:hypothetical protein
VAPQDLTILGIEHPVIVTATGHRRQGLLSTLHAISHL